MTRPFIEGERSKFTSRPPVEALDDAASSSATTGSSTRRWRSAGRRASTVLSRAFIDPDEDVVGVGQFGATGARVPRQNATSSSCAAARSPYFSTVLVHAHPR
jgi:hypothetical protein